MVRRGQFYLISAILVAIILVGIAMHLAGGREPAGGLSWTFENLKRETVRAVELSGAGGVDENLLELEAFYAGRMSERNYDFEMDYLVRGGGVDVSLSLESEGERISDSFTIPR